MQGLRRGAVCALCVLSLSACGSDRPSDGPSPPVAVTLSRSVGHRHDRFTASITTRRATGVSGRTRRSYTVAASAVHPASACVNGRDRRFPDRPAGSRVRAMLDPARGEGGPEGWCPGVYHGTVTYTEAFACPPKGRCHVPADVPTRTSTVARFSFRVR